MDPRTLEKVVRAALASVNKDQALANVRTLAEITDQSLVGNRVQALLLGVFAGMALLLAAVGIYGVIAYAVTQRTHELGIRAALGASAGSLQWLVFRSGMKLAAHRPRDRIRRVARTGPAAAGDSVRRRGARSVDDRRRRNRARSRGGRGVFGACAASDQGGPDRRAPVSVSRAPVVTVDRGRPSLEVADVRPKGER